MRKWRRNAGGGKAHREGETEERTQNGVGSESGGGHEKVRIDEVGLKCVARGESALLVP